MKTFRIEESKLVGTPMSTRDKMSKNDDSKEVNWTIYRLMIGKLQYVLHTRPDIPFVVGILEERVGKDIISPSFINYKITLYYSR